MGNRRLFQANAVIPVKPLPVKDDRYSYISINRNRHKKSDYNETVGKLGKKLKIFRISPSLFLKSAYNRK